MPPSVNLADLGRRVRATRVAHGLTLEEVVAQTDFTVSWLSKLENGQLTPSLDGLVHLAKALECGVDELVAGLSVPPRYVAVKDGDGRLEAPSKGRRDGATVEHRAGEWRNRAMHPVILHIPGTATRANPESFPGERFLLVLDGELKLVYGDEVLLLGKGDSVYLHAAIPHSLLPANRGSAVKVLSVAHEHEPLPATGRTSPARAATPPRARRTRAGSSRARAD